MHMKSIFKFLLTMQMTKDNYKLQMIHTGLKSRLLKIFCFPPEFEMKFDIYVVPKCCCCYDEDSVANSAYIRGQC